MKSLDQYWYSHNIIAWSLLPLSLFFLVLSQLRKLLYKCKVFKSYRAPVPVVIVGNISVGGTGKTPLIIELVKQLKNQGLKPAVISRGYGSHARHYPFNVLPHHTANEVGDEPLLIAQRAECPVVIGANRREDIELCLVEYDVDIILSDDGLQHYALQRDIEIAVIDSSRQFGNGFCLPAGPLRETTARLTNVDLVIHNGGSEACNMQIRSGELQALNTNSIDKKLLSQKIHAVAGIGNPQRFFDLLKQLGFDVIPHIFSDHYQYQEKDLHYNDELPVVMTEKDAVKCKAFSHLTQHWYLPIDAVLSKQAKIKFNQLISQVCNG